MPDIVAANGIGNFERWEPFPILSSLELTSQAGVVVSEQHCAEAATAYFCEIRISIKMELERGRPSATESLSTQEAPGGEWSWGFFFLSVLQQLSNVRLNPDQRGAHKPRVNKRKTSCFPVIPELYSDHSTSSRYRRSRREGGDPVRYGLR